jgi:hypothetical protein
VVRPVVALPFRWLRCGNARLDRPGRRVQRCIACDRRAPSTTPPPRPHVAEQTQAHAAS